MAPSARKGHNAGPVDEWLDTLGYYRKKIAYDETCLFRAISEQMFSSQIYHEKIRQECINYGREHFYEFAHFLTSKAEWDARLDRLKKHLLVCGKIELHLIMRTYRKSILLFDNMQLSMKELLAKEYKSKLFLCHMGEDHYDSVYFKTYIQDAGFCQSIVYNILYESVFNIPKVANIVDTMLYQKPLLTYNAKDGRYEENSNRKVCSKAFSDSLADGKSSKSIAAADSETSNSSVNEYEHMLKTNLAPFPFKVAKALDPTIYRNIEYDTWIKMRKELRLGDWYYGDNNLIEGSACVLRENGEENHCYIQKIMKHDEFAIVYLTKKGEKRRVRLGDLRPEEDAKPWPLPYRFSKHLVISIPKTDALDKKSMRKVREYKKRTTSKCSSASDATIVDATESSTSTSQVATDYEGAPLLQLPLQQQHQQSADHTQDGGDEQVDDLCGAQALPGSAPECTPNVQGVMMQTHVVYDNGANWQQRPDAVLWPPTPPIAQNVFAYPTIQPSAVASSTSEPMRASDPPQGFYYNDYQSYSVWPHGEYLAPLPAQNQVAQSPQSEVPITPDGFNYIFSDGSTCSPNIYSPAHRPYQTPNPGAQMEIYPPQVYQPTTISTPLLLTPGELLSTPPTLPNSHMTVYRPAIEVPCSYYPPSPFVFPPTPTQATWYQVPAVNSQGFIFPPVNETSNTAASSRC